MVTVEREIRIDAPPEKVFAYLEDPRHLPEFWPSMVEVKDITELPKGGHRFVWLYKMAGMPFEGETETIEFKAYEHFVHKITGEFPVVFDWTFRPDNGATIVTVKAEYEIPQTVLGKFKEPFIRKLNEREADIFAANLKDFFEL